jgi:hypothetical protein
MEQLLMYPSFFLVASSHGLHHHLDAMPLLHMPDESDHLHSHIETEIHRLLIMEADLPVTDLHLVEEVHHHKEPTDGHDLVKETETIHTIEGEQDQDLLVGVAHVAEAGVAEAGAQVVVEVHQGDTEEEIVRNNRPVEVDPIADGGVVQAIVLMPATQEVGVVQGVGALAEIDIVDGVKCMILDAKDWEAGICKIY